jgi:hypothetical protein
VVTKHCYTNYFGAETTNVHDAILAYRAAWDPYVMGVLRDVSTIADSFDTVAKAPPSGYTAEQLTDAAKKYRDVVGAMLTEWNQFSGLAPDKWEEQSNFILKAWQDVVKRVGSLVTTETGGGFAQGITWPTPPSQELQRKTYMDLSSTAVDLTTMNILKMGAKGGLDDVVSAANAVGQGIGGAAGSAAGNVIGSMFKAIPWYGIVIIGVIGVSVATGAVGSLVAPVLAFLPKPKKEAR